MGIFLSKNPLIAEDFDGESGDHNTSAENYQHPFGPEWFVNDYELEFIKKEAKDLDNAPDDVALFTLKGQFVPGKCVKVYDGDTVHFVIKFNDKWIKYRFRMLGYNSAEIRGGTEEEKKKGLVARDYLANRLLNKKALLYLGDFDKYGRPLVDVYLIDNLDNLNRENALQNHINKEMVVKGHGKPYLPR